MITRTKYSFTPAKSDLHCTCANCRNKIANSQDNTVTAPVRTRFVKDLTVRSKNPVMHTIQRDLITRSSSQPQLLTRNSPINDLLPVQISSRSNPSVRDLSAKPLAQISSRSNPSVRDLSAKPLAQISSRSNLSVRDLSAKPLAQISSRSNPSVRDLSAKPLAQISLRSNPSVRDLSAKPLAQISSRSNYITRQGTRIDSNIVSAGNNKGLVGLMNLGNTCYMNASLQCLRCVDTLKRYVQTSDYSKNDVTGHFLEFVKDVWQATTIYNPQKIRTGTALENDQFRNNGQHDAQEFLNTLMDAMHESLKENRISIISDTFYGKYETIVKCKSCDGMTKTYEDFMFLTLPVSDSDMDDLDGLIKKSSHSEELFGENQYYCEKCKKLSNALKVVSISKLPDVLIVHLKRFTKTNKINNFVNVPNKYGEHELIGVINHSGGLSGGHYTANVLINDKWYLMNDSSCRVMTENVITHQAYILFYEKK
uniref:USP domain-containing protein n=1 Tax=viral metagenome TaxID=1070528 RepID=A0A6C0CA42_9ZZZZ